MKRLKIIGLILLVVIFLPNKSVLGQESRILNLLVVADKEYQNHIPNWKKEISKMIDLASSSLEKQAGIKLEITGFENWERETSGYVNYKILLNKLAESFPKTKDAKFDVVMGLASELWEYEGCAHKSTGCIIINAKGCYCPNETNVYCWYWLSKNSRKIIFPSVMLHEIGHIFGCSHIDDDNSVMCITGGYPMTFDQINIQVIKKNKWRKFPFAFDASEN